MNADRSRGVGEITQLDWILQGLMLRKLLTVNLRHPQLQGIDTSSAREAHFKQLWGLLRWVMSWDLG